MKIALINIATNKYINFLPNLYTGADKNFLIDHDVEYVLFTNMDLNITGTNRKIHKIKIEHREWPYMTLHRYKFFTNACDLLSKYDYVYYSDVDMSFVSPIKEEILFDLIAVQHPGHVNKPKHLFTYERNMKSTAGMKYEDGDFYYAGGFNGGKAEEFLKLSKELDKNIDKDKEEHIIAKWHDESHLNKYFWLNKPKRILSPLYCWPDFFDFNPNVKIIALSKNHKEFRS
jgi:histo-blood group ABO system transferase